MGERLLSRRDRLSQERSAWERVPRKYRPVGYGMVGRSQSQRYFSWKWAPCRIGAQYLHESYRTLRDGSLGWRCSRHFVPGYDRIVPQGRGYFPHAFRHFVPGYYDAVPLGTKYILPVEVLIKLALMGLKPRAESCSPSGA
jgi:hypothetical protein